MTASTPQPRKKSGHDGPALDLGRHLPVFITFIANKLSNSAMVFYRRNFRRQRHRVTDHAAAAIEPGIPASRICQVIGFDTGPVGRTLTVRQGARSHRDRSDPHDGRTHSISLTEKEAHDTRQGHCCSSERKRRLPSCL